MCTPGTSRWWNPKADEFSMEELSVTSGGVQRDSAVPLGLAQWLVPNETHYSRITQEVAAAILLPAIYLN